jgi:hypothetical protein
LYYKLGGWRSARMLAGDLATEPSASA